jgi:hypothetical protein
MTTKLKWTRTVDTRTDAVTWTCGAFVIERLEFTLPTRSIGYILSVAGQRIGYRGGFRLPAPFDTLADAKEFAADHAQETKNDLVESQS